jgi:F420-dependent oxidoreductase-like protein
LIVVQLAANLTYQGAGELARTAERLGYDLVLAPEGYRSDAASVLGLIAGQTTRIGLASGVMQIPARPPGLTALTAATLDALSNGRFRLGLGTSNPQVAAGWYGQPSDRPLGRIREYVEIVRKAWAGGAVSYEGQHFRLPAGGQGGAPLHLFTEMPRARIPVYLAAVGPRVLQLAGEIADGWIGVFASPQAVAESVAHIRAGRQRTGQQMSDFNVMPCLPTVIADELPVAVEMLRAHYLYMLGIGDPEQNFYCALARQMGFGPDMELFRKRLIAGDRPGAGAAIPGAFIDQTALVGPVPRLAKRMRAYADAGVTTLGIMVSAAATSKDGRLHILTEAAAALRQSGTAG